jgi:hypothetical protein
MATASKTRKQPAKSRKRSRKAKGWRRDLRLFTYGIITGMITVIILAERYGMIK